MLQSLIRALMRGFLRFELLHDGMLLYASCFPHAVTARCIFCLFCMLRAACLLQALRFQGVDLSGSEAAQPTRPCLRTVPCSSKTWPRYGGIPRRRGMQRGDDFISS